MPSTLLVSMVLVTSPVHAQPLEMALQFKTHEECVEYVANEGIDRINELILKVRQRSKQLRVQSGGCVYGLLRQIKPQYTPERIRDILDAGEAFL